MLEFEIFFKNHKKNPIFFNGLNIGLIGEVGAGKTNFVRHLVKFLCPGKEEEVQSPTYNYYFEYELDNFLIRHFDLYRIDNEETLEEVGIFESLEDREVLCLIEWGDLFPQIMSLCELQLKITNHDGFYLEILKNLVKR